MKLEDLTIQIKNKKSFLCVGLDTDIDKIPKFLFLSFLNKGYERKAIKKAKLK